MHKQTVNKVIRLAYEKQYKYGIMAELLFSCGYRFGDVINLKKSDICNKNCVTLFLKEHKNGIRRLFNHADLPQSVISYIMGLESHNYLFPSNMYTSKGKLKPISSSRVKKVFNEIFGNIPKLRGAYGTHVFRKTFAYFEYRKGDIYRVKRKLGHKNLNSTIKYLPEEIFVNE